MVDEVIDAFRHAPVGVIVDATLGGGGHATAILEALPEQILLGCDQDDDALVHTQERLKPYGARAVTQKRRFGDLGSILDDPSFPTVGLGGRPCVSGVLADLGVSSHHFDASVRGFSIRHDGPLDMRMDQQRDVPTAADLVNSMSEGELVELFRREGETRLARRYARAIIQARPISRSGTLASVIERATPAPARRGKIHPATRVFQALRIAVNREMEELDSFLDALRSIMCDRGVVVVISYHSGEDKRVKDAFRRATTGDCQCPPRLPCVCGARAWGKLLVRGAQSPSEAEISANPRARSAKLRAMQVLEGSDRREVVNHG
jgi:16S rRNA (cytosine1402-N4)-methyltransferase